MINNYNDSKRVVKLFSLPVFIKLDLDLIYDDADFHNLGDFAVKFKPTEFILTHHHL